jgi:hypothetical protein
VCHAGERVEKCTWNAVKTRPGQGEPEGIGLGHEFLAHLERARLLVHVIDSSEGDADARWQTIDAELAAYGAGLESAAVHDAGIERNVPVTIRITTQPNGCIGEIRFRHHHSLLYGVDSSAMVVQNLDGLRIGRNTGSPGGEYDVSVGGSSAYDIICLCIF